MCDCACACVRQSSYPCPVVCISFTEWCWLRCWCIHQRRSQTTLDTRTMTHITSQSLSTAQAVCVVLKYNRNVAETCGSTSAIFLLLQQITLCHVIWWHAKVKLISICFAHFLVEYFEAVLHAFCKFLQCLFYFILHYADGLTFSH